MATYKIVRETGKWIPFLKAYLHNDDYPDADPGAFHSSELWYMFHSLKNSWRPFTKQDYELSDRMVDYWTNFCKYADPKGGWKRATRTNNYTQVLDIE